jgi:drug/metabolite transporter (DMT)-like permease
MFFNSKAAISYFCAFLTIILWGTLATVSKILLGSLDAMLVLAFTCDVSAVLLFVYNLAKGNIKHNTIGSVKEVAVMCSLGFVGFFLYNMFYLMGIKLLPSQQAMIINYLWPAMIIVFSCIFLKEKMTAKKAVAIALSFAGIIIVAVNGNLELLMNSNLKGVCFCLLAAVSYGFYAAINKGQNYNKEIAMMFAFATAGIIATVISVVQGNASQLNIHILPGLLYDAVFVNAIGYTSWMIALEYGNTAAISNLAYLTPFVSLVFARLVLQEQVSVYSFLGLMLIISGIVVQFTGNRK